jgi:predicted DNA-binding protein
MGFDPSLTRRYYIGNTGTMTKHTTITFKCPSETTQAFHEKVKQNGQTSSEWLRRVVEKFVKREDKKKGAF